MTGRNHTAPAVTRIQEGGVARVVVSEERDVNMSKKVMIEHCFKDEVIQETTKKRKTPKWLLCTFKNKRKNYMKSKIYIK